MKSTSLLKIWAMLFVFCLAPMASQAQRSLVAMDVEVCVKGFCFGTPRINVDDGCIDLAYRGFDGKICPSGDVYGSRPKERVYSALATVQHKGFSTGQVGCLMILPSRDRQLEKAALNCLMADYRDCMDAGERQIAVVDHLKNGQSINVSVSRKCVETKIMGAEIPTTISYSVLGFVDSNSVLLYQIDSAQIAGKSFEDLSSTRADRIIEGLAEYSGNPTKRVEGFRKYLNKLIDKNGNFSAPLLSQQNDFNKKLLKEIQFK